MRIIYSAGNRIGANLQLSRFLKHVDNKHELKIAAYNKSSYNIMHVDWLLNSVFKKKIYNKNLNSLKYNQEHIGNILKDVKKFSPDLIISDNEYIFGKIASDLNIQLWCCSPLNLINGIYWNYRSIYSYFFYEYIYKSKLPKANEYLIYSPFCDIKQPPILKNGYNWIRPYYNTDLASSIEEVDRKQKINNIVKYASLNNNYTLTDGNTDDVSDLFYSNKNMIITPNVNNIDSLINAELINEYNIGCNIGQIELIEMSAIDVLEKAYNKSYNEIQLNNKQYLQLHEKVEEYACSI